MRLTRLLLAGCLVATFAVPVHAQATGPVLAFDFPPSSASVTSVDLLTQDNATLRFSVDQGAYASLDNVTLQAVFVTLTKGTDHLDVSLVSPAAQVPTGTRWLGDLPVATLDLTKGTWQVQATAIDDHGTSTVLGVRALSVLAADSKPPVITVAGEANGTLRLGPSDQLAVEVSDALLRHVSYRLSGGLGEIPLTAPYLLPISALAEGAQNVTLHATDRAGNQALHTLKVILDTQAPIVTTSLSSSRLFVGVPATLTVHASDLSSYTVLANLNGTPRTATGTGTGADHAFVFTPARVGPFNVSVEVRDAVGNSVRTDLSANASVPETDSAITFASLLQPDPLVGDAMTLRITVEQLSGVVPLNLTVQIGGAVTANRSVLVPGPGAKVLDVPVTLPVGRSHFTFNVSAPAGINETNTANQNASLDVEVFFGRLQDGNTTYNIRAGQLGLPTQAVKPDGTSYALRLVNRGEAVVYEFTVPGNRTLAWDPTHPVSSTTQSHSSSSTSEGAKGAPGLALPVLLGALALAFAARRR